MLHPIRSLLLLCALSFAPLSVAAQAPSFAFGGQKQDTTLPVQVEADQLNVDQTDNTAIFSGNVRASQGEMSLTAPQVRVEYNEEGSAIERLIASGGVTLASGTETAEAQEAVYTVETGFVVMTGDVLLTQGQTAIAGQKMVADLKAGTAVMEGRVQTTFVPKAKQ